MSKLTFLLLMLSGLAIGQTRNLEILDATVASINAHSSDKLKPFLSESFQISGRSRPLAETILSQVFIQLADSVTSLEVISNSSRELIADITYQRIGKKRGSWQFNESGELVGLDLFKMEVKTLEHTSAISQPEKDQIVIPFESAGNLIRINVEVNGESRPFLLDTGAPRVILNSRYFHSDDTLTSNTQHRGVNGNISNMNIYKLESLSLEGIEMDNQDFLTMDLKHLEKQLSATFYGLIGYEFISEYDILFDYQKNTLTLLDPEKATELIQKQPVQILPLKMNHHIPVVTMNVTGKSYQMGIDSGAESNLFDDDLYSELKGNLKNERSDVLHGADKTSRKIQKGELRQAHLGDMVFPDMVTTFSDISHLNTTMEQRLDGLIGFQVLSRQPTLISFKNSQLVLFNR